MESVVRDVLIMNCSYWNFLLRREADSDLVLDAVWCKRLLEADAFIMRRVLNIYLTQRRLTERFLFCSSPLADD